MGKWLALAAVWTGICVSMPLGALAQEPGDASRDEMTGLRVFSSPLLGAESPSELEQAVGFYSNGSLVNASPMPLEGDGFVKIFRPRDHGWSTRDLIGIVRETTSELHREYPGGERFRIGDMSAQHGGPLGKHGSHQNGLDVDIGFLRYNHLEQDPTQTTGFDEIFVKDGKVTDNLDLERNWRMIGLLAQTGRLNRIFVDGTIKLALCQYARKTGEYRDDLEALRRLRPWPNHKDHMHVRISCPSQSPRCVAQEEPPVGTGCAELEAGP